MLSRSHAARTLSAIAKPGQLVRVEAGDGPGRQIVAQRLERRGEVDFARGEPESVAQRREPLPGQRGAQAVAQRALVLGHAEGDERPSLAVRGERVRATHALGRLAQHGAAVPREGEEDLPPASLAREHPAPHHAIERRPRGRRRDPHALEHLDEGARPQRRYVLIDDVLAEEGQQQLLGLPAAHPAGPVGGVQVDGHAVGRTASPRLARWICSYTCVRSSVNRGSARVVIWSRSGARSIARSSCTQVGDLESTITRSPR